MFDNRHVRRDRTSIFFLTISLLRASYLRYTHRKRKIKLYQKIWIYNKYVENIKIQAPH